MSAKRRAPHLPQPAAGGAQPLYTKAELARHFDVPESTIRYYCERFAPYLPAEGQGRARRYLPACLDVLAFIRSSLPEARTSRAVEALLTGRFPRATGAVEKTPRAVRVPASSSLLSQPPTLMDRFALCEPPENLPAPRATAMAAPSEAAAMALQLLERQGSALERIADALTALADQGRATGELRDRADAADVEMARLRGEVHTLRLLLNTSEKTQQDDLEQMRGWMLRLAKQKK